MTGEQFNNWVEEYNTSDIHAGEFRNSAHEWDVCLSSDLSRAVHTASQIYAGEIIYLEELREIDISAVRLGWIKLPASLWLALGRIAWYCGHSSQSESRASTILRSKELIDHLERNFAASKVLIVSHGAFMQVVAQQLAQKGYNGKRIFRPRNGELYVYEKSNHI